VDLPMSASVNARLFEIADQLHKIKQLIESENGIDLDALDHFRDALNEARMVSWVVSEWLHARQTQGHSESVVQYLTHERIRRFSTMTKEIRAELDAHKPTIEGPALTTLYDTVKALSLHLHEVLSASPRSTASLPGSPQSKHGRT
jgi:hypothetical protein